MLFIDCGFCVAETAVCAFRRAADGSFYYQEHNMKIKPLADRVLVKNEKAESKTASGIIIPEAAQEKTQTAKVVAVGPGTEEDKITVKVGERIMYDKYAGTQIKINNEDHLILKMSDIIAVIEEK